MARSFQRCVFLLLGLRLQKSFGYRSGIFFYFHSVRFLSLLTQAQEIVVSVQTSSVSFRISVARRTDFSAATSKRVEGTASSRCRVRSREALWAREMHVLLDDQDITLQRVWGQMEVSDEGGTGSLWAKAGGPHRQGAQRGSQFLSRFSASVQCKDDLIKQEKGLD